MARPRVVFGVRWDGRGRGIVLAAGLIASLLCTLLIAATASARDRSVPVVVVGEGSARAVAAAGGEVTHRVGLIDGVVARVPSRSVRAVRRARGVRAVVVDRPFVTRGDDDESTGVTGLDLLVDEDAARAPGEVPDSATTLDEVRETIGADRLAADGAGVDVALIDSGITPVESLGAAGKVVNAPDFSSDARDADLRNLDAFGHGTHLAGIVAGVAPGARLVNVKAADAEGITSLTRLLLALDWTVRNRRANGLDVRVITLAVGADNHYGYEREPLAWAVEQAWQAGIVVVAAAGNDGNSGRGLDLPAADPFVLAVGGSDTRGTGDPADDAVADWSSRGDGRRDPDVVAPGSSVVSLRVAGSFIDEASADGRIGETLQRGSGTSQAAAATSAAVALLLERHPEWTPNQIKAALRETARPLEGDPRAVGRGRVDVAAADGAQPADRAQPFKQAKLWGRALNRRHTRAAHRIRKILGRRWSGRRWSGVKWNGVKWNGVKW
ncbi:MAG TPA: S8 family serine peptidase [Solirubrobacteraceae bacterium]|nr:S8 family serine peptidase [Solirubrobacteraceae bacterium]